MSDQELTASRALDARVAEQIFGVIYTFIHGDYCMQDPEDAIAYLICPHYSTDIAAAFLVEEQISYLGLATRYASSLADLVLGDKAWKVFARGVDEQAIFAIAHASALQRCLAALQAHESE